MRGTRVRRWRRAAAAAAAARGLGLEGGESFAPRRAKIYHIQSVGASAETHSALVCVCVGGVGDQQPTPCYHHRHVCLHGQLSVCLAARHRLADTDFGGKSGEEGSKAERRFDAVEGLATGPLPGCVAVCADTSRSTENVARVDEEG